MKIRHIQTQAERNTDSRGGCFVSGWTLFGWKYTHRSKGVRQLWVNQDLPVLHVPYLGQRCGSWQNPAKEEWKRSWSSDLVQNIYVHLFLFTCIINLFGWHAISELFMLPLTPCISGAFSIWILFSNYFWILWLLLLFTN